jgi:CO/xanthine dehydrogenase FAD-binding subunit
LLLLAFLLKNRRQNAPVVIVSTSGIQELRKIIKDDSELFIGAQTSLTQLEAIFTDLLNNSTGKKTAGSRNI